MNKPDIKKLTKVNDELQETKTQWIRVQTYNKNMGQGKAFTKEQYNELEQMFKASEERMQYYVDSKIDLLLEVLARNGIK